MRVNVTVVTQGSDHPPDSTHRINNRTTHRTAVAQLVITGGRNTTIPVGGNTTGPAMVMKVGGKVEIGGTIRMVLNSDICLRELRCFVF
jgi:hypothetical protein